MSDLRISKIGGPGCWQGALKMNGKIIWQCGHAHVNRDRSTMNHRAASACAHLMLRLMVDGRSYIDNLRKFSTSGSTYAHMILGDIQQAESLIKDAERLSKP